MLRYKYVGKNNLENNFQDIEFIKTTRNHPTSMEQVFHHKKISSIEQEEWYENIYSQSGDHHVWIVYDEKGMFPIGYLQMKLESIQHQRISLGLIMSPQYIELGYEGLIIKWALTKGIRKVNYIIHKVQYKILDTDERMMNILIDNGFELDACLRHHVQKNQFWRNVHILSYLFDCN